MGSSINLNFTTMLATEETKTVFKCASGAEFSTREEAEKASIRLMLSVASGGFQVSVSGFLKAFTENIDAKAWLLKQLGVEEPSQLTFSQKKQRVMDALLLLARDYGSNPNKCWELQVAYVAQRMCLGGAPLTALVDKLAQQVQFTETAPTAYLTDGEVANVLDVNHSKKGFWITAENIRKSGYKLVKVTP